ncbi:MAG: alpha/beta hydrolase family protein [Alphaproteobacteria bacterium]
MANGFRRGRAAFAAALVVGLGLGAGRGQAAAAPVAQPPVEAFASLPFITNVQISPDGQHLAVVRTFEDRNIGLILRTGGAEPRAAFSSREGFVRNIFWLNNDRALMYLTGNRYVRNYRDDVQLSRLVSVSVDGKDTDVLMRRIQNDRTGIVPQSQVLLSRNLHRGRNALVAAWTGRTTSIYSVSPATGVARLLKSGLGADRQGSLGTYTADWMTSPDLKSWVRWNRDDKSSPPQVYVEGSIDGGEWKEIQRYGVGADATYGIVGFSETSDSLYVLADRPGKPTALYEYDLKAGTLGRLIYAHPRVGLSGASLDGRTGRLLAATYTLDEPEYEPLDPERKALQTLIDNTFQSTSVNRVISQTADHSTFIIRTSGPSSPAVYYYAKLEQRQAAVLGQAYPGLDGVPMGAVKALTYAARDGLPIRAYLTLPPDVSEPKTLPMVILPHGGPHSRDLMVFDYQAQFLANRGYAVFQPNFRGSTGYGQRFLEAGYGEWGGKMQDDVTDGVQYLIREGIADRDRICIMGGSYGGYAALMGGVKTPDLYRCIVSINGVTSLGMVRRESRDTTAAVFSRRTLGAAWDDRDVQRKLSPADNAEAITAPVLLIHGREDLVVEYRQARAMDRALRRAGKEVTFVSLDGDDHFLSQSETRIAAMQAVESFLARHLR